MLGVLVLALLAALPAQAQAAPPANDQRATPTVLTLPAAPRGTTSESTLEEDEPGSCAQLRGSIWYSIQAPGCTALALYAPGTADFDDASPVKRAGCGGYFLFTPAAGEGGRYSLLVTAQPRRRGDQRYHLQVAEASGDDTSLGLPLANYERARGSLQGSGVDAVDIYRFSLARRSLLRVSLRGNGFKLQLLRDTGHRVASSDDGEIERRVKPGRYFLAVRSPRSSRAATSCSGRRARSRGHGSRSMAAARPAPRPAGRSASASGCARRWPVLFG